MADVKNEPPILLHPDVDKAQTTTFINENFRKISDAVNTYISNNTFNIVSTGTASLTLPNPIVDYNFYETSVAHNLGYFPAFLAYADFSSSGGGLLAIPATFFIPFAPLEIQTSTSVSVDSTNIYFDVQAKNLSFLRGTTIVFKYYLLKENAN